MARLRTTFCGALTIVTLLAGCASNGPPIAGYADGDVPKATAIVTNHDSVLVLKINGRSPRSHSAFIGDQSYAVPAGPCTLDVVYREGQISGVTKTLTFTALADHKYRLNSYVAPKITLGYVMGSNVWDARIEDEAATGFVAETRDARK